MLPTPPEQPRAPAPLRVAVITGSTREGRVGGRVTRWFVDWVGGRSDLDLTVIDLADFTFPARYPTTPTPETERFTARVGGADAFVVVTPEYNRSFPASLKQAIDFAYDEWQAKPVGFVSYGCASGGRYAVEALRPVFTELHTVTMRDVVSLDLWDEDGGSPPWAPAVTDPGDLDGAAGTPAGLNHPDPGGAAPDHPDPSGTDPSRTDPDHQPPARGHGTDLPDQTPQSHHPWSSHGPPAPVGDRTVRVATAMLDQLVWWGLALREARGSCPYVV